MHQFSDQRLVAAPVVVKGWGTVETSWVNLRDQLNKKGPSRDAPLQGMSWDSGLDKKVLRSHTVEKVSPAQNVGGTTRFLGDPVREAKRSGEHMVMGRIVRGTWERK